MRVINIKFRRVSLAVAVIFCCTLYLMLFFKDKNEAFHLTVYHKAFSDVKKIESNDDYIYVQNNLSPQTFIATNQKEAKIQQNFSYADFLGEIPDLNVLLNTDTMVKEFKMLWIQQHIRKSIDEWKRGYLTLKSKLSVQSSFKRILLYPGFISYDYYGYDFAKNVFEGGYVGELIIWGDLISALYLLKYELIIEFHIQRVANLVDHTTDYFDLVITDYIGANILSDNSLFGIFRCKIRILDSFGTEPRFSFLTLKFNPQVNVFNRFSFEDYRQLFTMFPHTPDNSFLGFMLKFSQIPTSNVSRVLTEKPIAVLYGKEYSYINFIDTNAKMLEIASKFFEIHATMSVGLADSIPPYIINHGTIPYDELTQLLRTAKLFIGLGFPYEGPGPFDALAQGCVFLQPLYIEPQNRDNNNFFQDKPTVRELTSQHPYLENFGGDYVKTIDMSNEELLISTLVNISNMDRLPPFIPYEFTSTGFLERVCILVEKLDVCNVEYDLALNALVSTSDNSSASVVTNGIIHYNNCYRMKSKTKENISWVSIDLIVDQLVDTIKLTLHPDWTSSATINMEQIVALEINLTGNNAFVNKTKIFAMDRIIIVWRIDIPVLIRTIRISPIHPLAPEVEFSICEVQAYLSSSRINTIWPSPNDLLPKVSNIGESCSQTCFNYNLLCERSLFTYLNNEKTFSRYINCSQFIVANIFDDFNPSSTSDGECSLNNEELLFSCAGKYSPSIRLCPCVPKHPGQNGVPIVY